MKIKRIIAHLLNNLLNTIIHFNALAFNNDQLHISLCAIKCMRVKFLGKKIRIGTYTYFIEPQNLTIGNNAFLNEFTRIAAYAPIEIGNDFMAAAYLSIDSGSHDLTDLTPKNEKIIIGSRVWCGTRVTICAGSIIGDGAVIGSGSVVMRKFPIPAGWLAIGIPAKPIKLINKNIL